MASKPRNVDLGPLYVQVGEESDSQTWTPPSTQADTDDVVRFDSLLRRNKGRDEHHEVEPELLPAPLHGSQPQQLADPQDIGDEIAHLWVGTGLESAREVRVGLREALLPETSVRLHESEGRLCIEFTCATVRVADWLYRKLPALAGEMGERLKRPLGISVSMEDGRLVGTRDWPGAR